MSEQDTIDRVVTTKSGSSRQGAEVSLIVVRPAAASLDDYKDGSAPAVPNYFINLDGETTTLVRQERAGALTGVALWKGRRRNIDRISVSIALQRAGSGPYPDPQLVTLNALIDALLAQYGLDESAVATVDPSSPPDRPEVVTAVPPAPGLPQSDDDVLGGGEAPIDPFWEGLFAETVKHRGGAMGTNQAFARQGFRFDLGAPLAINEKTPVEFGGKTYNYQVFARDLIFNEGRNWGSVQNLGEIIGGAGAMPAANTLGLALLSAAYDSAVRASGTRGPVPGKTGLQPGWGFHQIALKERLGPALTGNYTAGAYQVQVFAGDTLYHPVGNGKVVLRLSQTAASDAAYGAVWAETYKVAGAAYDPNSPFQQAAAAAKIGTPLTGVYQATIAGAPYSVQVFALDTLYAGADGQVKRLSGLPKPDPIANWKPAPPVQTPAAPPSSAPPASAPNVGPAQPGNPNWPPKPDYNILMDPKRAQVLGKIEWVAIGGDNVKITNNWVAENIVEVFVPQLAKFRGGNGGKVKFHRIAADAFRRMWQAWEDAGLLHLVLTFDGTWVPRTIRGIPTTLSNHAFGTAFDINYATNGLGVRPPLVGEKGCVRELVPLANAHGFYWGGHWEKRYDGMHFEWAR